jgi:hypothetical protein
MKEKREAIECRRMKETQPPMIAVLRILSFVVQSSSAFLIVPKENHYR